MSFYCKLKWVGFIILAAIWIFACSWLSGVSSTNITEQLLKQPGPTCTAIIPLMKQRSISLHPGLIVPDWSSQHDSC